MVLQDGQSTPKLAAINFLIEAEPALQLQIEVTSNWRACLAGKIERARVLLASSRFKNL
jgi:hypothetical protein